MAGAPGTLRDLESERSEIDRLFAMPLDRFTPAREELAARLRREGRVELARQVKKLRKPTAAAWAVDQLVRRRPERMAELMRAGEALRGAQTRVLGGAPADELREASKRERELVTELTREAASILERSGFAASPANVEPVRTTLSAAASADEGDRWLLGRGWLSRPLRPASFGELLGEVPLPEAPTAPWRRPGKGRDQERKPPAAKPAEQEGTTRERLEKTARRRAERRRLVRQARAARDLAAREAADEAREAEQLEAEAAALKARSAQLERAAERARRSADEVRSRFEQTSATARARRDAARQAARSFEQAEERLVGLDSGEPHDG